MKMSRTHRYTFEQLVNEDFMEKSSVDLPARGG